MKREPYPPGPLEDLAELSSRVDVTSIFLGRVRPIRTTRGLVAVVSDDSPTRIPLVESVVFDGDTVTVDTRAINLDRQSGGYRPEEPVPVSCTLDELSMHAGDDGFTEEVRRRSSRVGSTLARIVHRGSAYDALHRREERVHPVSGASHGAGYYFDQMLLAGEQFPPAVLEAGLAVQDHQEELVKLPNFALIVDGKIISG